MSAQRRTLTQAEEVYLVTQVGNCCPLCASPLFYNKGVRSYKQYEVAHIYPLNPTPQEIDLLSKEQKLHSDPNHVDNLIPLCMPCHGKFDKPRTANEYRDLLEKKKQMIEESHQQVLQVQYMLEEDIVKVIQCLHTDDVSTNGGELQLEPKDIKDKLDDSMSRLTQRKIRLNVSDYFLFVRRQFVELERGSPHTTELIAAQVRAYYMAQRKLGLSQQQIFTNVVDWLLTKTHESHLDAVEIIASFFVQNCELFE